MFASCSSGFALMLPGTTFKSVPASLLTSPSSAALTLAFSCPSFMLKQLLLCAHRNTHLYWSLADGSPSCLKVSGIITECLLLLLVELNIPTLPGVKSGHSLRQVAPLLRMLLVRLGLSSWLGA